MNTTRVATLPSCLLTFALLLLPLSGNAVELVLDDFEFSPYTAMNPDSTPTVVAFPTSANPGGWDWTYAGYGTPASGDRNATDAIGAASWRFLMPTAANQSDPEPSTSLTSEGPVLFTRLGNSGFEARTLDQVVSDLGGQPIDWSAPVRLEMQVKARWQASGAPIGSFSSIEAGILVFDYDDGGALGTVTEATFGPADNDTWQDLSIELVGRDVAGDFFLGMFGSVDFAPSGGETDSPQLEFFFDDLRLVYSEQRDPGPGAIPVPALPLASLMLLVALLSLLAVRAFRRQG